MNSALIDPKISVVIPVYNGQTYIRKTLESVLAQEYPAHEVIVINDGSTDGTQSELDRFGRRITVKTTRNEGVAAARNTGIDLATGEYIALLDADDIWFKIKLKSIVEAIKRNPQAGFICSDYFVRHPEFGNKMQRQFWIQPGIDHFNFDAPLKRNPFEMLLLYGNFVGTPSAVVFKKAIAKEFGYFKSLFKIVEDLYFFLGMAMRTSYLIIGEPLFYKRTHHMNMSNDKLNTYLGHRGVLQSIFVTEKAYIERHHLQPSFGVALANINYAIGNMYYEFGDRNRAFEAYREALRSSATPKNILDYLWIVSKKSLRSASHNKISRRNFGWDRLKMKHKA